MTGDALSITVFVYAMISLFSFLNVTYIRDFDALQINVVPVVLSIAAITEMIHSEQNLFLTGMTVALIADSYFAMRYQQSNENIEYTNFELFAQESWTSEAFEKTNQSSIQFLALSIIFA